MPGFSFGNETEKKCARIFSVTDIRQKRAYSSELPHRVSQQELLLSDGKNFS